MGTVNMAHIYAGSREGYPPCTPQAVVELLDFYGIDVSGKKVTIVGAA
jgi:methylenetetrahydrofolate dehydrogenase (NADP+)/methenyltetrahydrofolate cyclohydrolase